MIGNVVAALIGLAVGGVICFFLGIRYRKTVSEKEISSAEEEGKRIINEAIMPAMWLTSMECCRTFWPWRS